MTAKEHYDNHLGDFYSWMTGDLQKKQEEHQQIFRASNILPGNNNIAVDLGCGHGIQSLALAHLGFNVMSVDFSQQLLKELDAAKADLPIALYHQDLLTFLQELKETVSLITCMGDTITHLDTIDDVGRLLLLSADKLLVGGKLVISFRDLTTELKNEERFIPVKSDHECILTCYLEYYRDKVMIYDILWKKENDGWKQRVSSYPKLRLSENFIKASLEKTGFSIKKSTMINRMIFIVAERN